MALLVLLPASTRTRIVAPRPQHTATRLPLGASLGRRGRRSRFLRLALRCGTAEGGGRFRVRGHHAHGRALAHGWRTRAFELHAEDAPQGFLAHLVEQGLEELERLALVLEQRIA